MFFCQINVLQIFSPRLWLVYFTFITISFEEQQFLVLIVNLLISFLVFFLCSTKKCLPVYSVFRSVIHSELNFLYDYMVRVKIYFFQHMALQLFVLIPFAQKIIFLILAPFGRWLCSPVYHQRCRTIGTFCIIKRVGHFWALFCFTDLFAYLYSNSTVALITVAFVVSLEVRQCKLFQLCSFFSKLAWLFQVFYIFT